MLTMKKLEVERSGEWCRSSPRFSVAPRLSWSELEILLKQVASKRSCSLPYLRINVLCGAVSLDLVTLQRSDEPYNLETIIPSQLYSATATCDEMKASRQVKLKAKRQTTLSVGRIH